MPDLKDALDLLDTGNWCALAYVSYDEKRGTAGNIVRIKRARLASTASTGSASGAQASAAAPSSGPGRSSKPRPNGIRKVKLDNGQLRDLHIHHLFAINEKKLI